MHVTLTEQMLEQRERNRIYTSTDGSRRLNVGDMAVFHQDTVIGKYSAVLGGVIFPSIGSFSYTQSQLPDGLSIGRYCSIAPGVGVIGGNHPTTYATTSSFSYDPGMAIFAKCLEDDGVDEFKSYALDAGLSRSNRHELPVIENDVWIGGSVVLARGITLGTGCIVAAQSVVTKSVPPYAIVGGNPARIIRMRLPESLIPRLLVSQWWKYKVSDFGDMDYNEPERFLEKLETAVSTGKISAFDADVRLADLLKE